MEVEYPKVENDVEGRVDIDYRLSSETGGTDVEKFRPKVYPAKEEVLSSLTASHAPYTGAILANHQERAPRTKL